MAIDFFEPGLARARGALEAFGFWPAGGVEGFQCVVDGPVRGEKFGERFGVLQAGADVEPD